MRLSSDFWVAAFMRDVRNRGGFAYLLRRGMEEAGTIFIKQAGGGNSAVLFGPAAQSCYGEKNSGGGRLFMQLCAGEEDFVTERLYRELDFDPDIWIVEIENISDLNAVPLLQIIETDDQS